MNAILIRTLERNNRSGSNPSKRGFAKAVLLLLLLTEACTNGATFTIVDTFGDTSVWKSGISQGGKIDPSNGQMVYSSTNSSSTTGGALRVRSTPALSLGDNWSLKVNGHLSRTAFSKAGQFSDVFLGVGKTGDVASTHVTLEFGRGEWGDNGGYYIGNDVRISGTDLPGIFDVSIDSSDVSLRMDYTAADRTLKYYYNTDTNAAAQGVNWVLAGSANLVNGTFDLRLSQKDTLSVFLLGSSGYQNVSPGDAYLSGLEIAVNPADSSSLYVTVNTIGNGSVSPDLNGKALTSGKNCKLTAKAAPGYVFAGWTGSIVSRQAALSFAVHTNMSLMATFIPNPFTRIGGTYQGLFLDPANVGMDKAGPITITPTADGTYSGKFILAGKSYSVSGVLYTNGWASNTVAQTKTNNLDLVWQVDLEGGLITGALSGSGWSVPVTACRAGYSSKSPWTNGSKYTLVVPGGEDSIHQPGGDGIGSITVSGAGTAKWSGTLADGTTLVSSYNLSASRSWPVFSSLYSGKGMILGWLSFTNQADSDIQGDLFWIKQAQKTPYYAAGFSNQCEVIGSAYTTGGSILNLTNGNVWLSQGSLMDAVSNSITLSKNKVLSTNKSLKMSFTTSTGLFSGSLPHPEGGKRKALSFKGAVLQKQNVGCGFFLDTNQSGRVVLEP